jgi:urocanate hydratase
MMSSYQRGDVVILLAYGGAHLTRRVWEDAGAGVLICSEAGYQEAIRTGQEPNPVGWPREDVLEIVSREPVGESD